MELTAAHCTVIVFEENIIKKPEKILAIETKLLMYCVNRQKFDFYLKDKKG